MGNNKKNALCGFSLNETTEGTNIHYSEDLFRHKAIISHRARPLKGGIKVRPPR